MMLRTPDRFLLLLELNCLINCEKPQAGALSRLVQKELNKRRIKNKIKKKIICTSVLNPLQDQVDSGHAIL